MKCGCGTEHFMRQCPGCGLAGVESKSEPAKSSERKHTGSEEAVAAASSSEESLFAAAAPTQKKQRFLRKKEQAPADDDDDEPLPPPIPRRSPKSSFLMKRPPAIGGTTRVVNPCELPAAALAAKSQPPEPIQARTILPIEQCTGLLVMRWDAGFTACGTATLIASRKLLTAKHNVFLKPNEVPTVPTGGNASSVTFYPGFVPEYNGGKPVLVGCGKGISVTNVKNVEDLDIAILTLEGDSGVHEFPKLKECPKGKGDGEWTLRGYGVTSSQPEPFQLPGSSALSDETEAIFAPCTQTGSSGAAMLHDGAICAVVRSNHQNSTIATPFNKKVLGLIEANL